MSNQLIADIFLFLAGVFLASAFFWLKTKKTDKPAEDENSIKKQLELEKITNFFSQSLVDKNDVDEVLWDISKNLIGKLGFEDCIIYLWNDDKTKMVQKAGYGPKGSYQAIKEHVFEVVYGQGVVGYVMRTKQPVIIADTGKDPRYRVDDAVRASEICVPILYNTELIGIIDSEHSEKGYYNQGHVNILTTIATLIANKITAIKSSTAVLQKQLELEKIISFFSASMVDKHNVDDLLWDVSSNLIGRLGFEDCMIYLWNREKTMLEQKAGYGHKGKMEIVRDREKYNIPKGKGIIGAAAEMKTPLIINDTSGDPRYFTADGVIRLSEICVQIIKDEEQIGMINAESSQKDFFTPWHVQTLATIATLIANKIKAIEDYTALHQKQLELATASSRLASTELTLLRSQMNPHFIFNSLNSVQKYIWENKEEDAAEYLASFARLMRAILENSRHEYVTLRQEAEILNLYIDLEHRRSNYNFDYTVKIDEQLDLDYTLIPPMLLQPFIENAIWHGLNKKQEKGNLFVHIFKHENELVCVVEDDGVGRQETKDTQLEKKSLGISITKQRIEKLIRSTSETAAVEINDKITGNKPSGTLVKVIIPLQLQKEDA